ncbi:MAG: HAD-IB family hydrolase [Bacteroidia bacterium]|nr:HAD-IB family hydrolase [Bacteroidia bacterium]
MEKAITVAAFDFDHTLLKGDSMMAFFRYYVGYWRFFWGMNKLSPKVIRFLSGRLDRQSMKESVLKEFLAGKSSKELFQAGLEFSEKVLPAMEKKVAMERLQWHKDQGHLCLMVTASMDIWTKAWAETQGLTLIATKSRFDQKGIFTGEVDGINNWGPGKEKNLQTYFKGKNVEAIYAYGDSSGDKEMLKMADFPFYRTFSEK